MHQAGEVCYLISWNHSYLIEATCLSQFGCILDVTADALLELVKVLLH